MSFLPSADDDNSIVFLEGARTPVGAFLGSLAKVSATDLGVNAANAALARAKIAPDAIDNVVFGNVIQSSKDAAYLARHVGLRAGVPENVPALTVNRACASGLDAIWSGAKSLRMGESTMVLAGGAENMSMTPYAMRGVRQGWKMIKSDVDDMLFSALFDPEAGCSIGETVEHLAHEAKVSRADADEAAVWSQQNAHRAQQAGIFGEEIAAVTIASRRGDKRIEHDENLRPETDAETLAKLPGLYDKVGVVSAGNSSGLNDAGCALVMTTKGNVSAGCKPLGRLVSFAAVGVAPKLMGLGPVEASRLALSRAELTLEDMNIIEINDSFSVQYVAVERELKLNRERVNVNGGAIALGHPMGATGARLVLTALYELRRRGGGRALCTVCVGGGQGVAAVVEV